ncbi:MAG: T9SS type A sorting domain-containing protein [Bacteroidia bacterium]|nr:T9SS type A sorting domain-containing protein [Bacteroidia bacterium]
MSKFCLTAGCGIACGGSCNSCSPLSAQSLHLEAAEWSGNLALLRWEWRGGYPHPLESFIVERLEPAGWRPVIRLEPATTTYLCEAYLDRITYFRLRAHSPEGHSTLSNIAALYPRMEESPFSVVPNPATDAITIFTNRPGEHQYEVLNGQGQVVKSWLIVGESAHLSIDLPAGLYWIRHKKKRDGPEAPRS